MLYFQISYPLLLNAISCIRTYFQSICFYLIKDFTIDASVLLSDYITISLQKGLPFYPFFHSESQIFKIRHVLRLTYRDYFLRQSFQSE